MAVPRPTARDCTPEKQKARIQRIRAFDLQRFKLRPASDRADVLRLQALGPLDHLDLDLLAFRKRAEALGLDRCVVAEDVSAAVVLRDEAEALRIVEPLHGTGDHCSSFAVNRANGSPGPSTCIGEGARLVTER